MTALIFLGGYLGAYDRRLIWIIEYADVVKVGLVALTLLFGFSVWISTMIDNAYIGAKADPKRARYIVGGIIVALLISLALFMWGEYRSPTPHYSLIIFSHLVLLQLFIYMLMIIRRADEPIGDAQRLFQDFFSLVFFVTTVGLTLGTWNRDTQGFNRDVYLRDANPMREVGIVMITSKYVVLWTGDHSVIIPASEVLRIEERPKHTTK